MAKEYGLPRGAGGGGGHEAITLRMMNRAKDFSPVNLKPDVSHLTWHLFLL